MFFSSLRASSCGFSLFLFVFYGFLPLFFKGGDSFSVDRRAEVEVFAMDARVVWYRSL